MQTRHEYMMHELKKLIRERMEHIGKNIATGGAEDFARYQRMVGTIEGLGLALDICDEAEKIVDRTV